MVMYAGDIEISVWRFVFFKQQMYYRSHNFIISNSSRLKRKGKKEKVKVGGQYHLANDGEFNYYTRENVIVMYKVNSMTVS